MGQRSGIEAPGAARVTDITVSRRAAAWATAILFALLVLFAAIALFHAGAGAFFEVPRNFNEGWNAYFARAAFEGALYLPYDAPITNNYPPLSFYLIGALAKLGGDPIYIGRFLSGAALLLVAVDIYLILRFFAVERLMAAATAIAFLGIIAIGFPDYVATNDPQWLAHGVMMTGLTGFLWGYPRRGAVAGAALVMLAAGLIKHNLLPIPLAVTAWLLWYDRSRFWLWLAVCAGAGAAAMAALWMLHGPVAFEAIFMLKRQYLPIPFAGALYEFVAPTAPLLVLFFASGALSDRRVRLLLVYAVIALVWDPYTMSAVGVAENGIFDYLIAVALLAGLSLGRAQDVVRLFALAMILLPIAVVAGQLPKPHRVWQSLQQRELAFKDDEALLRSFDGPAMCHATALCYWAGKPFDYDPFNTVRKMKLDPEFRRIQAERMRQKYFAILQVYKLEELPAEFADALNDNYVFFHASRTGWKYYRPK